MPRYSIITPTLVRPSLIDTCKSIDEQSNTDWEHLIAVDVPLIMYPEKRKILESIPKNPRRKIFRCGKAHKNFGNTCRYNLHDKATGDYILYLDDDDRYINKDALKILEQVDQPWAIFPCLKVGVYWLLEPPGICKTGSNMFMYRREIGRYHDPDQPGYRESLKKIANGEFWARLTKEFPQALDEKWGWLRYAADGMLVEELKSKYPYQILRGEPLTSYECANKGK